jgi:hypothetical protein
MKSSLRRTSCSQADELTWLSPGVFSQDEAVKPQPMLNPAGLFRYRRLSSPKFLASNSQSFELRFRCGARWLPESSSYSPLDPCTRSAAFAAARLLTHLHHRSQQPVTFQLSSICNRPLFDQNSRLRLASEQSCDCPSPTELRVPTDVSKHPPSCEGFNFETQARAIQDISRSRASEFTPLANRRKRNHKYFCEHPVQNLSMLWSRVDKEGVRKR